MEIEKYFLLEREKIYQERSDLVKATCHKYKGNSDLGANSEPTIIFVFPRTAPGNSIAWHKITWLPYERMAYCSIPKTGTNTWSEHIGRIYHIPQVSI